MQHNLEALTPHDFEAVVKSILDRALDIKLELFKPGKDGGVDLKHAYHSGSLIVQCKHWPAAKISQLESKFKSIELPKMLVKKPTRYVIATSAGLSPNDKQKLVDAMAPFVVSTGDVWGRSELEYELDHGESIVRAHLRLWLNSSAVLNAVLHQATILRSHDLAEQISNSMTTFVQTPALKRAQELLNRAQVVLISGPPGIGKTTLAHVLCAELIADGFELIMISRDVKEGLEVWSDESKQVFVYDDFLGRSALGDHLGKNEDQELLDFVNRVTSGANKRFIMTTRGYILAQARRIYEKLASDRLRLSECLLVLSDLDEKARALILYNHVWGSDLDPNLKAEFADAAVYRPIIRHKNYSPRLVRLSLDRYLRGETSLSPGNTILRNMNDPSELWAHAVKSEVSDDARMLLDLIFSFGARAEVAILKKTWTQTINFSDLSGDRFDGALRVLEGDFLTVVGSSESPEVASSNPSLDDYMIGRLRSAESVLIHFANYTGSFEHLRGMWRVVATADAETTFHHEPELSASIFSNGVRLVDTPEPFESSIQLGENLDRLSWLAEIASSPLEALGVSVHLERLFDRALEEDWLVGQDLDLERTATLVQVLSSKKWANELLSQTDLVERLERGLQEGPRDWENLSVASELAGSLSGVIADGVAELCIDLQFDYAKSEIESFDFETGGDSARLRSIVDFTSAYSERGNVFPGLDIVEEFLGEIDDRRADEYKDSWYESRDDEFEIDQLMRGLNDE